MQTVTSNARIKFEPEAMVEYFSQFYAFSSRCEFTLVKSGDESCYLVADRLKGVHALLRVTAPGAGLPAAAEGEVRWMTELLKDSGVIVPRPIPGRNGMVVQQEPGVAEPALLTLFSVPRGNPPEKAENPRHLAEIYALLGETAALLHQSAILWGGASETARLEIERNPEFSDELRRPSSPLLTRELQQLFGRAASAAGRRLRRFGRGEDRFGLINAALTPENLLVDGSRPAVSDFSRCGFSWFLYDLAVAVAESAHLPACRALTDAWLSGYRRVRKLPRADVNEIPTLILLRRLRLLGERLRSQAPDAETFLQQTAGLAETYLKNFS